MSPEGFQVLLRKKAFRILPTTLPGSPGVLSTQRAEQATPVPPTPGRSGSPLLRPAQPPTRAAAHPRRRPWLNQEHPHCPAPPFPFRPCRLGDSLSPRFERRLPLLLLPGQAPQNTVPMRTPSGVSKCPAGVSILVSWPQTALASRCPHPIRHTLAHTPCFPTSQRRRPGLLQEHHAQPVHLQGPPDSARGGPRRKPLALR